ncbi:MAG: replication-relaxation family protein [Deferribacteres bacterium]|nr:replication-relaxation family protein [candidate division KSB1 bacterium]MCB9501392.1 replication-relaxation family protein [Deferribacteres bacterium]
MRLTKRDYEMLWRINQCMWLSTTQLKREFFPDTTDRAIQKRLKVLVGQGFLFAKQRSLTEEQFFRLGSKARQALIDNFGIGHKAVQIPRAFPTQLKHFSTLNDIRWYLERSVAQRKSELSFIYVDKELKRLMKEALIIPDILCSFMLTDQKFVLAIEYDAGTENPQYFGRDKVKKYVRELDAGMGIFGYPQICVLVFADTRQRILSLIQSSLKFLNQKSPFYFASLEDLQKQNDLLAEIYINPAELKGRQDDSLFQSIL